MGEHRTVDGLVVDLDTESGRWTALLEGMIYVPIIASFRYGKSTSREPLCGAGAGRSGSFENKGTWLGERTEPGNGADLCMGLQNTMNCDILCDSM